MSDEERIEQLELENKVLQDNNKGLKTKIDEQSKEIEELKDESKEYQIGFAQGCYEKDLDWKDKIKAKIEEIENEDKKYKNYLKDGRENFTPEYVWARPVLQSLLEKKGE